jgi:hypothetical protein
MNNELERIWKEAVVAYRKCDPGVCLDGLRKITKTSIRITDVPDESRTLQLPNTILDHLYSNLHDISFVFARNEHECE